MPHAEYSPIRELFGGRNKVLLAERKDRLYALKFVNLTDLQPGGLNAAVEELKLLRTLNHPNVIRLRECEIIHKNSLECMMIVTDFAQGGSLAERFEAMQSSPITLDWLLAVSRWSAQTAAALKYCHEKNVIHRDLKLENILISASGDALLADFGFARELSSSGHASTVLGTPSKPSPARSASARPRPAAPPPLLRRTPSTPTLPPAPPAPRPSEHGARAVDDGRHVRARNGPLGARLRHLRAHVPAAPLRAGARPESPPRPRDDARAHALRSPPAERRPAQRAHPAQRARACDGDPAGGGAHALAGRGQPPDVRAPREHPALCWDDDLPHRV